MFRFGLILLFICRVKSESVLIEIDDGKIIGNVNKTLDNNLLYFAFYGIPYGQPPLGNLRFEEPLRNSKWKGILDCTKEKNICITLSGNGSEDCLHLSVYTPNIHDSLPVYVWISGGRFVSADASYKRNKPDYFLEHNIVFVTINYRQGIFGFSSTGDEILPGNLGMKDQILALRWIQNNIKYFGGNPGRVTIGGHSSGGACVAALLQTNLSKGLFNGAIMQSGTTLNQWSRSKLSKTFLKNVVERIKLNFTNSSQLVNNLKYLDVKLLKKVATEVYYKMIKSINILNGLPIAIVLEADNKNAVFSKNSHEMFLKRNFHKVPVMLGFTSMEALHPSISQMIYELRESLTSPILIPISLNINNKKLEVASKIWNKYFKTSKPTISEMIKFVSEDQFVRPIVETAKLISKYSDAFLYEFNFANANRSCCGHSTELPFLFPENAFAEMGEENEKMGHTMIALWTNFIKYGNPTPYQDNIIWPKVTANKTNYLHIGKEMKVEENPHQEDVLFYQEIFQKFGKGPFDTY